MDMKAVVIPGEAPESDEDAIDVKTGFAFKCSTNASGTMIYGEATESDEDGASLSSTSAVIDVTTCPQYLDLKVSSTHPKRNRIKYNSLLHKKLHECNESLRSNILRLTESTITTGIQELTNVNKQLIKSEHITQEAACQLRNASARWKESSSALFQLIDANFLNNIRV